MPRRKRDWRPHAYYHVGMRGNNRDNIFQTHEDKIHLMRAMEYTYAKHPFTLLAYCIMSNHYHLIIRSETNLSKIMAYINRRYSDYYSKRYDHVGRIYEKRYYSGLIQSPQALLSISSYIHRNPIDTTIPLVQNMEDYPYSSFMYYKHNNLTPPPFMNTNLIATYLPNPLTKTNESYCLYCLAYKEEMEKINF